MKNNDLLQLIWGLAKTQAAIIDALDERDPGFRESLRPKLMEAAGVGEQRDPSLHEIPAMAVLLAGSQPATAPASIQSALDKALSQAT